MIRRSLVSALLVLALSGSTALPQVGRSAAPLPARMEDLRGSLPDFLAFLARLWDERGTRGDRYQRIDPVRPNWAEAGCGSDPLGGCRPNTQPTAGH
jgi:hypothetical protein